VVAKALRSGNHHTFNGFDEFYSTNNLKVETPVVG